MSVVFSQSQLAHSETQENRQSLQHGSIVAVRIGVRNTSRLGCEVEKSLVGVLPCLNEERDRMDPHRAAIAVRSGSSELLSGRTERVELRIGCVIVIGNPNQRRITTEKNDSLANLQLTS